MIYDQAPDDVRVRVDALIEKHYPDLKTVGVRLDLLQVSNEDAEPCLSLHGYDAAAIVRVIGKKDRVAGRGDAEIVVDWATYEKLSEQARDALLDHELYHLQVKKDKHGALKFDDHGRPVLKIRLHDWQLGWFDEIARRHGEHSLEVQCARALARQTGQLYFALDGLPGPTSTAKAST